MQFCEFAKTTKKELLDVFHSSYVFSVVVSVLLLLAKDLFVEKETPLCKSVGCVWSVVVKMTDCE